MKIEKLIEEKIKELRKCIKDDLVDLHSRIKTEDWFEACDDCKWLIWDFTQLYLLEELKAQIKNLKGGELKWE